LTIFAKKCRILAMRTINISLPESLAQLVSQEVRRGGFASVSEYIRNLIRRQLVEKESSELPLPLIVYKKRPLEEVRKDLEATGKYNKKFIDSLIRGLARSSVYAGKKAQ
jgi:Arc/MetJ-type ribon-helix-helix transcriptional regulator